MSAVNQRTNMPAFRTILSTLIAIRGSNGSSVVYETRCECEREECGGDSNVSNNFDALQIIGAMADAYASVAPNPVRDSGEHKAQGAVVPNAIDAYIRRKATNQGGEANE